jgi:hypothetical protein
MTVRMRCTKPKAIAAYMTCVQHWELPHDFWNCSKHKCIGMGHIVRFYVQWPTQHALNPAYQLSLCTLCNDAVIE